MARALSGPRVIAGSPLWSVLLTFTTAVAVSGRYGRAPGSHRGGACPPPPRRPARGPGLHTRRLPAAPPRGHRPSSHAPSGGFTFVHSLRPATPRSSAWRGRSSVGSSGCSNVMTRIETRRSLPNWSSTTPRCPRSPTPRSGAGSRRARAPASVSSVWATASTQTTSKTATPRFAPASAA